MRITQGMMKRPGVFNQAKQSSLINGKKKKDKSVLEKLMADKNKIAEAIKSVGSKDISQAEKAKQLKALNTRLKSINEMIKVKNDKLIDKKDIDKKREVSQSKLRVAQIRKEAFDMMLSGNKSTKGLMDPLTMSKFKDINDLLATRKIQHIKKAN